MTLSSLWKTEASSEVLSLLGSPWNSSTASWSSANASLPSVPPMLSPNVAYTAAELVIAVLSTVGNVLVCVAVGINRKLRTVTNYFLVSLAVADIGVGIVAIPASILTAMGLPHHNLYLCLFMLCALIMFAQSSVFSLLAVAVERYVAIFMPLRYQTLMAPHNALLLILAKWLLAIGIGLVPLMGWHLPAPDSGYCLFVLVMDMTYIVYMFFFTCFLVPLAIMAVIYARVFYTVKRQLRRIACEQGAKGEAQDRAAAKIRREMKMAVSLFLVLFLFAVCWIPIHIINCFLLMCPQCPVPPLLLLITIILSHANSAINPFLYAYTMTTFRDTFKAIFLYCRTVGGQEDDRGGVATQNTHPH